MVRKKIYILLFVILVSLISQIYINKPESRFTSQPSGWPGTYTTNSLSGMVSKFNQDLIPAYISTHDVARILAYASMAYNYAKYDLNGGNISGSYAFSMVVNDITRNKTVKDLFMYNKNDKSIKAFNRIKAIYSEDGYNNNDKVINLSKNYLKNTLRSLYMYKPPLGHNSEIEKGWGLLKTIGSVKCTLPPPPAENYIDLVYQASKVDNIMGKFQKIDPDKYSRILFLITYYTGAPAHRNEPARLLSELILNIAYDSKLSEMKKDKYIEDSLVVLNDAHILSWYYKYHYSLIHPLSILPSRQITNALPNGPSYPSEYATIASALETIYDKYQINVPVRMQIKGSLTAMPTTRVFKNFNDFSKEFSEVLLFVGYNYEFDIPAGYELGKCIGGKNI